MAKRVQQWDAKDAEKIVLNRLTMAKEYRKMFEFNWIENKAILANQSARNARVNITYDSLIETDTTEPDQTNDEIQMNYTFKYKRFIHSQLSANPPSCIASPTSSDSDDKQKADASDRVLRHMFREKNFQETFDLMTDRMLVYGIAWIKTIYNPDGGELDFYDRQTQMLTMKGDIEVNTLQTEDIWIDPDARQLSKIRYMFERHSLSYEAALFQFPDKKDEIAAYLKRAPDREKQELISEPRESTDFEPKLYVFEYYEKADPTNGMAGRHVIILDDGTFLTDMDENPHLEGQLPYHGMTYLDNIDSVYGKSIVEYTARMQDVLNSLDGAILANLQAHSNIRMAVPEAAEINDDDVTDSVLDIIKYSGGVPPTFMSTPSLMPDIWRYRDSIITGLQDLFGINDSMLGIQRREQSAASQQTSIESGTMIHRRVFKKYEEIVKQVNKSCLGLAILHWDDEQIIKTIGKEKAFETVHLRGTDLEGGVDLQVEYGTSLPLDPNQRRESIMLYKELFTNAGMSDKQILKFMRFNDLGGAMDRLEMAGDRQKEIIEEMIAVFRKTGKIVQIPTNEFEEHQGRLEYAYDYVETEEFKYLPRPLKEAIWDHMKEREEHMAKQGGEAAPESEIPGLPGVSGAMGPELQTAAPELV